MAIKDYNSTASNNTTISGIGIQGTNAVSNFDGAFRQIMADVANWTDTDTIASAGTTDLSTVDGTYITVSGTTTITAFGTLKSGMFKFLKFDGALTLTHNATSLILPRAANITTVAGDTAAFVSLGSGNWRCLFFERTTAASERSDLGLGTAATQNTGTSGANVPLLNGTNTWSAGQTFSTTATFGNASIGVQVSSSGGIEIYATTPLIDFKNNAADDYDVRIIQVGAGGLAIDTTAGGVVTLNNPLSIGSSQVVSTRVTGWGAATGTATRTTFATSTVTTAQLAERVKALIDDLITHGLIGA